MRLIVCLLKSCLLSREQLFLLQKLAGVPVISCHHRFFRIALHFINISRTLVQLSLAAALFSHHRRGLRLNLPQIAFQVAKVLVNHLFRVFRLIQKRVDVCRHDIPKPFDNSCHYVPSFSADRLICYSL